MKMENEIYPNLQEMCRLCLKENAGTIYIFPKEKNSDKYAALSIPMRIMTCAALEVQEIDDFPSKICNECRFQLEKCYYFRKMSQASDVKLRKHLRLVGMGKISKVFAKKLDEDEDDEIEFQDSLDYIKEQEVAQKQEEQIKFETILGEMKLENEERIKKIKENLRLQCREELIPEIRDHLRNELRLEVENELEENLRKEISEQCLTEAKKSLRNEIREECRQFEIKSILDDLQSYLIRKSNSIDPAGISKDAIVLKRSHSPTSNKNPNSKIYKPQITPKVDLTKLKLELNSHNAEKDDIINENILEEDMNTNDDQGDSEGNFLIYDTDDGGFDVQQKPQENNDEYGTNVAGGEYEDDEYADDSGPIYDKVNEENIDHNEEYAETLTTSYRIDNESGEIQFLEKSHDNIDLTGDQNNEDIVVINFPDGLENDFVEEIKYVKEKKKSTSKSKKSPGNNSKTVTKTSTFETKFLTKTYVNPMQRSTDTPKVFKCDDCPMVFSTKASVERHLRTHQKVEKTGVTFQCPECRIVVSCSSALRRHMYVHCEEKPFSCTVCEKSFVQKEILKRHMQTHTGVKPHQCPSCERSFAQRINLTQHINRIHLKEPRIQQHSCHLCPKRFNHASGLSRHLVSHSGMAFQCSECDRTYGDRSSIKRHIMTMHNTSGSKQLKKEETA